MGDKMFEYWINSILSAPITHIRNVVGNTVTLSVWFFYACWARR
jgi:hypothetical protein